ncbi:aminotransferase [Pyrobaculum sp.]|uniref:aminotransferase n=1 Tax=Pyrobaculum sp. TaxID=2004705 RepID=UPI00316BC7A8
MIDLSGSWLKLGDTDLVKAVHETVVREFGKKALQYTDTAGAPEPREELRRILERLGFGRHAVLFTASLADSLRLIAEVNLDPGECISPEDPTQREVLPYAKCGRPKAVYVQPYWRCPDGYIYTAEELRRAEKEAPLVIYDLTYSLLRGEAPHVAKSSIAVGSLDVLFPGLHLGFLAVPRELEPYYLSMQEGAYLHVSTYMQYLFYVALRSGAVHEVFNALQRRQAVVKERLVGTATPYFVWYKPPSQRLRDIFLSHGAVPGSAHSKTGEFGEYVRLGLTSATEEELADFLSKIPL